MPNINDAFPSKYLKASDLDGKEPVVTIDRVEYEEVGRQRDRKPVVYFAGKEKGLVLNKTNANTIIKLTDSPVTEEWHGARIKLFATMVEFAGEQVEAIRVKKAVKASVPVAPRKSAPRQEEEEFDSGESQEYRSEPTTRQVDDDDIPF